MNRPLGVSTLLLVLTTIGPIAQLAAQQTLLTIEPTTDRPRSSEGDLIELKDGRLCLIYTRFTGGTSDHAAADLAMRLSSDGGESWSEDQIVVAHETGNNVMSVSLLRLVDGRIALFYLRKQSLEDCRPVMRISADEAGTFGPPQLCIEDEVGYYVLNNDRAVQLTNGRLVLPVALHNKPGQAKPDWAGVAMCYFSDNGGATWQRSESTLVGRLPGGERVTVQEPGVVELADNRLLMFCRTDAGSQFVSHSDDGGDNWTELVPSSLASPLSPASIERNPWNGELLCVWNDHSGRHPFPSGKRTPLCIASSRDQGQTWGPSRVLEGNPEGWYCYTAMAFVRDRLVIAYCAGDKKVGGLNRLRVRAVRREELTSTTGASPTGKQHRFFQSKDARLHFVDEGSGVPVLLIHGFAVDLKKQWRESGVIDALIANGYRVIAYDNRGHGKSERPHSPQYYGIGMVEDVRRLLDHLNIEKAHVVGYSMGAVIASKFRERHPSRILSATLAGYGQPPLPDHFTSQLEDEIRANLGRVDLLDGNDPKSLGLLSVKWSEWLVSEESLRRNQVPSLALSGAEDHFLEHARELAEKTQNLQFKVVPGDHGNAPSQAAFVAELLRFLAQIDDPQGVE